MTTTDPNISLVINTTDRAGPLRTLLRVLEHQSFPRFEVVVVVGPTRDNTLEVLSEYENRVRVLRCPKANLSQSRNTGLLAARGEIVAFIDDDAVPSQRWLEQLARIFKDPCVDASGGIVYSVHPDRPVVQHRIGIISSLAEQFDVRSMWLDHILPPGQGRQWVARMMGTNMAFRRRSLLEIGGFDEYFEWVFDDADVAVRMTNAGKIVHPVLETAVYHVPASSRNRTVFSPNGRWWIQTKASVYFSAKNGRAAGDGFRTIARRGLYFFHGHWLWYGQLRRSGELTSLQALRLRTKEIPAALNGFWAGFFRPPRLIAPSLIEPTRETTQPILKFQNSDSPKQPHVDPVSGYQPTISLREPPLRICLLSGTYPPAQVGGVGRLTHLMARGLFECGHTVHVITRGERDQVSFYDGGYVHGIACRPNRYHRFQRFPLLFDSLNYSHAVYEKVKRLKLNDGIQIVDSSVWQVEGLVTAVSGIAPVVVRLLTALRQIAAIQHDQSDDVRLIGEMERLLIERATHMLPNTQATLDAVQKAYDVQFAKDQCTIVPYGVVPVADEDIRPFNLERHVDAFSVLFVGRLEKRKGILDLFQAIPLVLEQVPNARFTIAGSDNSHHDGFQRRMGMDYPTHFASRYPKLAPFVEFKGLVDEETLQSLYQSCDLFVAPSLYESFGLIYLEAMNYAKPVIGCRAGGVPEVVDHGVTGLLVEPEAPKALADSIISLLKSREKLFEVGVAGRQRLLERFTYLQMARNFERAYRAVIRNSTGGA